MFLREHVASRSTMAWICFKSHAIFLPSTVCQVERETPSNMFRVKRPNSYPPHAVLRRLCLSRPLLSLFPQKGPEGPFCLVSQGWEPSGANVTGCMQPAPLDRPRLGLASHRSRRPCSCLKRCVSPSKYKTQLDPPGTSKYLF